jgi:hypothetical protein
MADLAMRGSKLVVSGNKLLDSDACLRWQGRKTWEAVGGTCSNGVFSGGEWSQVGEMEIFRVPLCDENVEDPGEYYTRLVCDDTYAAIGSVVYVWGPVRCFGVPETELGAELEGVVPSIADFAKWLNVYYTLVLWDSEDPGEWSIGEAWLPYWSPCESAQDAIDAAGLDACDGTCQDGTWWCVANFNTTHCPGDSGDPYPDYPYVPEGDPCA